MENFNMIYPIIFGFCICFFLSWFVVKLIKKDMNVEINRLKSELNSSNASDRSVYLGVLRREIGNILINRTSEKYLNNYYYLMDESKKIDQLSNEQAEIRIHAISQSYPMFTDFDLIQTRDYILYTDGVSHEDDDELFRIYNDIIIFSLLMIKVDEEWGFSGKVNKITEEELNHLKKYIYRINDTKLISHLYRAKHDYSIVSALEQFSNIYENKEYIITELDSLPDMALGVYIKNSDEYGIFSSFYDDDSNLYESYHRTDKLFDTRISLNPLHISYCWPLKDIYTIEKNAFLKLR